MSISTDVKRLVKRKTEVGMFEAKRSATSPYARREDFCRVFYEEMNSLYVLAYLLTADGEKAERCFVSGLEDSIAGNPVFKEWARSWARRTIIQGAVRLVIPRPTNQRSRWNAGRVDINEKALPAEFRVEIEAVLALEPFERFVYVMTVLECYSDHECALLLNCARRDVIESRTLALQALGSAMEKHSKLLQNAGVEGPTSGQRQSPALGLVAEQNESFFPGISA